MGKENGFHIKIFSCFHPEKILSKQAKEDLIELHGKYEKQQWWQVYAKKKISLSASVIGVGILLSIILCFLGQRKNEILVDSMGTYVEREDIGGKLKEIEAQTEINSESEKMKIEIAPRSYTQAEFYQVCNEISQEIHQEVLGENPSFEKVSKDLNFITGYKNYPIQMSYLLNDYSYIHSDGSVDVANLEGEMPVVITFQYSYQDYLFEEEIPLLLTRGVETKSFMDIWKETYIKQEKDQKTEDRVYLPTQIEGKPVYITEKKEPVWLKIGVLFGLLGVLLYLLHDYDLHKQVIERRQELLREYPGFVSKLMLYLGAGISTKNVMYKLCEEYGNKRIRAKEKNYLYEELKIMIHEMDNGVYEYKAYESFGIRCKVTQYKLLMTLLVENSKKGSKDILALLEKEGKNSFELRKMQAKRWGEKAGTKLLLPMMLLFAMVMILIMVPAFLTYNIS